MIGKPFTPENLKERRGDLVAIATVHNFAEVVSILVILFIIAAEAFWQAMGLTARGGLGSIMADDFRESGITGGWRYGKRLALGETAQVLVLVLVARVVGALVEENYGSSRYGTRRAQVTKKLVELLLRDGSRPHRVMWSCVVLGQFFILPEELAFYGQSVYRSAQYYENQEQDDENQQTSDSSTPAAVIISIVIGMCLVLGAATFEHAPACRSK